jgi:hypothetical protein
MSEVPMKVALAVLGGSLVVAGCATGPLEEAHAPHHPPEAAATAASAPTPGQMDSMMKSMQEMHDRMRSAKTPQERESLMQEHGKVMHDGMAMMGRMHGGMGGMGGQEAGAGMPMRPEMMRTCMRMMQLMMKMMLDREATRPPATP